jgi:hypothetical protein
MYGIPRVYAYEGTKGCGVGICETRETARQTLKGREGRQVRPCTIRLNCFYQFDSYTSSWVEGLFWLQSAQRHSR